MKVRFNDIEIAFEYVSSGSPEEHAALLSRDTGEIYYQSEIGDSDELPEDFEDSPENYVSIPHKNDLDLGKHLVLDFVEENLPEEVDTVRRLFSSRGAYGRYKAFLEQKSLLAAWYQYEDSQQKQALREWCNQESIDIED